jgi:large subunit ribosomal protein L28
MAKSQITGKRQMRGHNVSHSNIKTGRWQKVNVQRRRLWVSELNRFVTVQVATSDLRTITKIGLLAFAKQNGYKLV